MNLNIFLTILLNLKKERKRKFKNISYIKDHLLKKIIYCPKIIYFRYLYWNAGLSKKNIPMMVANLGPLIPDLSIKANWNFIRRRMIQLGNHINKMAYNFLKYFTHSQNLSSGLKLDWNYQHRIAHFTLPRPSVFFGLSVWGLIV